MFGEMQIDSIKYMLNKIEMNEDHITFEAVPNLNEAERQLNDLCRKMRI